MIRGNAGTTRVYISLIHTLRIHSSTHVHSVCANVYMLSGPHSSSVSLSSSVNIKGSCSINQSIFIFMALFIQLLYLCFLLEQRWRSFDVNNFPLNSSRLARSVSVL